MRLGAGWWLAACAPWLAATAAGAQAAPALDRWHDRFYLFAQRWIGGFDAAFARSGEAPLLVPASPLRIGLDGEWLHTGHGATTALRPDFEATVHLPNVERRFTVFVSSTDLQEAATDPTGPRNPLRAGLLFGARAHTRFELGVRVRLKPVAFAAVRWSPDYQAGPVGFHPVIKPYLESGTGLGASTGLAVDYWRGHWITRSVGFADWQRKAAATRWSQGLQFGHVQALVREDRSGRLASGDDMACGTLAQVTASGWRLGHADAWEAGVIVRRPLHAGWLYGYVEPLVRWERASGWHPDAGARLGLDLLFWGPASVPGAIARGCD